MTENTDQGRFSLNDEGAVLWQKDTTNPLPGIIVATMVKGSDLYAPRFATVESASFPRPETLQTEVETWFAAHLDEVLGPILRFAAADGLPEHIRTLAATLKANGGVATRQSLEKELAQLDQDQRKILRQHRIRLGPILIFFHDLLKPASLKLKALLWGVHNEQDLPVTRPKDGLVSQNLEDASVNHDFYRMLGYPVLANRAIRIDMLDRVVTDIYDSAKEGLFRAQHKYAEWLGCSIDSMYAVLEALGHRKVEDAAPAPATDAAGEAPTAETPAAEVPATEPAAAETTTAEAPAAETPVTETAPTETVPQAAAADAPASPEAAAANPAAPKPEVVKPELAQFRLRKGRMSDAQRGPRKPRPHHGKGPRPASAAPATGDAAQTGDAAKQPYKKGGYKGQRSDRDEDGGKGKGGKPRHEGRDGENREHRQKRHPRDNKGRDESRAPRVITAEPKKSNDDDSPFAILKNLKF